MQDTHNGNGPRQGKQLGNTILEFALVMTFLLPMFAGAFTIGMALAKSIQVTNVARDALVLLVRSTTDPNSGLDLSLTQNQRIVVRAAQGLGLNSDAQYDPSTTGNGVVYLSKVVKVGPTECSVGTSNSPPWSTANCPNYGSYVFAYRVAIGNTTRWSSTLGSPGGTVQSNGTITAHAIANNTSDQVSNFTGVTGMTLTASTYALISEMFADISSLNFFNVLPTTTVYARGFS